MNYNDLEISDQVLASIDAGRKIDAIKTLREESGLGLKEAKEVVDSLVRAKRGESGGAPGMVEEGGSGGMIRMIVVIAIVLSVYFYFFAN